MTTDRSLRGGQGMDIDWDVPIEMDDGISLRADVYRPAGDGRHPVILSYGPYGKGLHFGDGSPRQWDRLVRDHPDVALGSSNSYQCYELVDPERWVPDGYVCVRVDSRGAGRSPGELDPWSPRETHDLYECIEWAGTQVWSNGRVGLSGISYYAINQWQVAALEPPHLAALCVWEGASDLYRELAYHGGIHCTFADLWYQGRVVHLQHGLGERGPTSRFTGDLVSGPDTLSDEVLESRRVDFGALLRAHPMFDEYWAERVPDLSEIRVPLLSAGNWGGAGLHLRGNIEGFTRAGSDEKWLEMHGLEHWTEYYTDYGVGIQRQFFDHFLKDDENGWKDRPRLQLQVRHVDGSFSSRGESEWPLTRTKWIELYLSPRTATLDDECDEVASHSFYESTGEGITFLARSFDRETEITGPLSCKLFVSSDSEDADLFVIVRAFAPDMSEVTFQGANEPDVPMAQGWLRASHRELDPDLSRPYRPFHTHRVPQPLTPGEIYELEVEIWPTCLVLPAGYRIGVTIRGRDYAYPGRPEATRSPVRTGVGPFPFRHDATDRIVDSALTVHGGGEHRSRLLVPVIPPD